MILMIDDNPVDRTLVRRMLDKALREPLQEAATAAAGLALAASSECDLVLLDNRLPDRDGIDVLPELVKLGKIVVLMSAMGDERLAAQAIQQGASDYLPKDGLTPTLLARVIDAARERTRMEQERVNLWTQLQQAQRLEAVGRLAGGVAHDFNNIVMVVHAFTQLAQEQIIDPAVKSDLQQVLDACHRATELTRRLLAFSRRDKKTVSASTDAVTAVTDLAPVLERLLPESLDLQVKHDKGPLQVNASATVLEQILMNLVLNANDAMSGSGVLRIALRRKPRPPTVDGDGTQSANIVLTVADDGVGMAAEVRERCFEPFFTTKGLEKGTGLGLSMCYGLASAAGGSLTVDSTLGEGTTMTLTLPEVPPPAAVSLASGLGDPGITPGHVLLVEDDDVVREGVRRMLADARWRVSQASAGDEALAVLDRLAERSDLPDLVLTDLVMPRVGGVQLYRTLRTRFGPISTVFMTGYSLDVADDGGASLTHILHKPFDRWELSDAVARAMRG